MTDFFYAAITVISMGLLLGGSRWSIAALAFLLPSPRDAELPIPALTLRTSLSWPVLPGFHHQSA